MSTNRLHSCSTNTRQSRSSRHRDFQWPNRGGKKGFDFLKILQTCLLLNTIGHDTYMVVLHKNSHRCLAPLLRFYNRNIPGGTASSPWVNVKRSHMPFLHLFDCPSGNTAPIRSVPFCKYAEKYPRFFYVFTIFYFEGGQDLFHLHWCP
jgi:hypothetical protein